MLVEKAVLDHLGHHALVEAGRVQIGRLLGLQQLGIQRGRRDEVAQAQAGRQDFAERAQIHHALGPARQQGRRRRLLEPQLAIGVVLDDGQAELAADGDHLLAARFVHGAAGGVLEVGQQVDEARALAFLKRLAQCLRRHAAIVAGHVLGHRLHGREGLQRAQVGGRLDQQAAALVEQHLGDQVQPLLAAGGDEHLLGRHGGAVLAHFIGHPLAQLGQAFARRVLQRRLGDGAVLAQHGGAGIAHGVDGKGLGRRQAAGEVEDAGALGHLQDFADGGGVHGLGALGQVPGGGGLQVVGVHGVSPVVRVRASIRGGAHAASRARVAAASGPTAGRLPPRIRARCRRNSRPDGAVCAVRPTATPLRGPAPR